MKVLYEKIKKLADDRGVSINQIESELGFSRGSIYKWDKNVPSVFKIKQVADYFGITVDSLINGDG